MFCCDKEAKQWWIRCMRVCLVLLLFVIQAQARETRQKYVNERFGFSLFYPCTLIHSTAPIDGPGRLYYSADNEFQIATAAHLLAITDPN